MTMKLKKIKPKRCLNLTCHEYWDRTAFSSSLTHCDACGNMLFHISNYTEVLFEWYARLGEKLTNLAKTEDIMFRQKKRKVPEVTEIRYKNVSDELTSLDESLKMKMWKDTRGTKANKFYR